MNNRFWYCRECGAGVRAVSVPDTFKMTVRHVEEGLHELRLVDTDRHARPAGALPSAA